MKTWLFTSLLMSTLVLPGSCKDAKEEKNLPSGKPLVVYFSATGNTKAVAEQIAKLTGADICRIEAAEAYNTDPYHDSDRVKKEAYEDLRPKVANLPEASLMAKYDTIFVGSPIWWHQPAMVICTFLDAFDLKGKTIIPFFTYDATTYLNESMQKIYRLTPHSRHIPATLPEDLDPGDITTPGRADDEGIDMPGSAAGVKTWLKKSTCCHDFCPGSFIPLNSIHMKTLQYHPYGCF
ncbi:MAG: flavodoxin [Akkermansia muciniphila]